MESITDINYDEFKLSPLGVLVVSTSWCKACKQYEPVLRTLSRKMPFVRYGKTVIDKDRSGKLKKEHPGMGTWTLPTTLLFRGGKEILTKQGSLLYPDALKLIEENIILGSGVYIPHSSKDVRGIVKRLKKGDGSYSVELTENSGLGRKGSVIEVPENTIKWDLESRV